MDVPEGWAVTNIPSAIGAGVFSDGDWVESKDQDSDGNVRLIQLADVGDGKYRNKSARFLNEQTARRLECTFLEPGDILIARMPEPLGRACSFPGDSKRAITAVDICIVRPAPDAVDAKWMLHAINSPQIRAAMEDYEKGTTRKRISRTNLGRISFLMPPFVEQKRIVAKVEELLARVNAARERLARAPVILKRFRQSILAAACSGELTADWRHINPTQTTSIGEICEYDFSQGDDRPELPHIPDSWRYASCESLCDPKRSVTYGVIKLGPYVEDGIHTLRSSDVRWLRIDLDGIKRISPRIAREYSRTLLDGGEVVVTVRGTLGGVSVVPCHMKGYNVSREVAVVPLAAVWNSQFFALAIGSQWSQNWLTGVAKGVAYTGINIADLKQLPLPVPPVIEQHEVVRRVEALFALADKIEARTKLATVRVEKITQAILAKAFRGELVPTEAELARAEGRDYEPATALLARIYREREAADLRIAVNKRRKRDGSDGKRRSLGNP